MEVRSTHRRAYPAEDVALKQLYISSLHCSQILRDLRAMQAQAAELPGYAGKFPLLFWSERV
jgi:hypothetical protein